MVCHVFRVKQLPEWIAIYSLQWRHDERDDVSNQQPHDCLLNRLFKAPIKETSKLRVTGLCEEDSPMTGEFPAQRASNAQMLPFDDVIMLSISPVRASIIEIWMKMLKGAFHEKDQYLGNVILVLWYPHFNGPKVSIMWRECPCNNGIIKFGGIVYATTIMDEKFGSHNQLGFYSLSSKIKYRKASKPRDWMLWWSRQSGIWQASRQWCCRGACQMSERLEKFKAESSRLHWILRKDVRSLNE